VKAGGFAQALMLPIIAFGALYLRHKRLPSQVAPGRVTTVGLWVASITIILTVAYSLILSLRAWL
jgi:hypothetical protein